MNDKDKPVTVKEMVEYLVMIIAKEVERTRLDALGDEPITIHADAAFGLAMLNDFIHSKPRIIGPDNEPTGDVLDVEHMFRSYAFHRLLGQNVCPDCGKPWSEHEVENVKTH